MRGSDQAYTIEATDHIGITVSSLDAAIDFFTAFLGTAPTVRRLYADPYLAKVTGVEHRGSRCVFRPPRCHQARASPLHR